MHDPKTQTQDPQKSPSHLLTYFSMAFGAFIAAFSIKVFFLPNNLIDGGTVGLAMIAARAFGSHLLPMFLLLFTKYLLG